MDCKWVGLRILILLVVAQGCGGSDVTRSASIRGEGSIPLGRSKLRGGGGTIARIGFSDGSTYTVESNDSGMVRIPSSSPLGPIEVELSGGSETLPVAFSIDPGRNRSMCFDATLYPRSQAGQVTSVDLGEPLQLRLGESRTLRPSITGQGANNLTPSFWASGGVCRVLGAGVVKANELGVGSLTVEVLGITDTITVTVVP